MDFVNLCTVFSDESEREFRFLESQYDNLSLLKDKILKVANGFLNNNHFVHGKKILLKPNWVRHAKTSSDKFSLVTQNNFIRVTLEIILEHKPKQVVLGDAPIQSCDWNKMIGFDIWKQVKSLSTKYDVPIIIKDFRRTIWNTDNNKILKDKHSLTNYVICDLSTRSYLESISKQDPIFRVTNYDPNRLARSHSLGIHKYCITKEFFDADVVISLPKVKTHQKTGITCALKNLVGLNGDKDFLPHHRVGGTGFGGDCYPGRNYFRRISEFFLDHANMNIGKTEYYAWIYLAMFFWKVSLPTAKHQLAAGWYGNDTTWRMVMDLNIIAKYGKADGSIANVPQREVFSLCDGIIGGQGDGPLRPEPLALGLISFSNSSALTDAAMAIFMGFDIEKIPLVKNAVKDLVIGVPSIYLNGYQIDLDELREHKIRTIPPPGWIGQIEYGN